MGYIDKHLGGERISELLYGGRVPSMTHEQCEWTGDLFDTSEALDLCDLMDIAETAVHGRRKNVTLFDAAPNFDVMQEIFDDAVLACVDAGPFRGVQVSYKAFVRDWHDAARHEALDVGCPSYRAFEHAVEMELRHRVGSTRGQYHKASFRTQPINPTFGH